MRNSQATGKKPLKEAEKLIASGKREGREIIAEMKRMIEAEKLVKIDYVEIVDANNLKKLDKIIDGETLIALAVRVGPARLIDNVVV